MSARFVFRRPLAVRPTVHRLAGALAGRLGGGLDVTLGLDPEPWVRWPDLAAARGRIDGPELIRRLPSVDGACVLSFDRARDVPLATEIVHEVLLALSVAADVVVVDLPRPDHEIFAALTPSVDAMVLLAGSGIRDLAGASAFSEHLIRACPDVWLSLRTNGKGGHFADTVAGALDLPFLAVVREVPSLAADLLHGIPPEVPPGAPWLPLRTRCWRGGRRYATGRPVSVTDGAGPRSVRAGLRRWAGCAGSRSLVAVVNHARVRLCRGSRNGGAAHDGRRSRRSRREGPGVATARPQSRTWPEQGVSATR